MRHIETRVAYNRVQTFEIDRQSEAYKIGHMKLADRLALYDKERKEEDEKARAEFDAAQKILLNAKPDGTRCTVKACVFPALLKSKCRQHYVEQFQTESVVGCAAAAMIEVSGMGVGGNRYRVSEED